MVDITVPVPDERTAEFYRFFGAWLAGSLTLAEDAFGGFQSHEQTSQPQLQPWGNTEADLADAAKLWAKFSSRARAMFNLLIDNPGKEFSGEEIAEAVDIPNGAHGVAGVLAWPGRHGYKLRRGLPSDWRWDEDRLEGLYGMSEQRAALFKAAREQVEGQGR